jgi:hypothetical protein
MGVNIARGQDRRIDMSSCRPAAPFVALGCLAALSCATLSEPAPAGPPAFVGVRKIALVRVKPGRDAPRGKDALDALGESLSARGFEVTRVEIVGRPAPDQRGVDRLYARLDGSIASAHPRPRYARRLEAVGADAGEIVRSLGVDAVAMYHRYDDRLLMPLQEPPPGALFPARPEIMPPGTGRPAAALSLVDREGNATWFGWGVPNAELDPTQPVNAADAIDMLLRTLRGEAEDGED